MLVRCFGCHGYMNLNNLFFNLILVLIQVLVNKMCINNQIDPLLKGDNLLLICSFCKITDYLMVWFPKCVYIIHISVCRSKIICFEIAAFFCKISDG